MKRIRILKEDVSNKIAAGEVVERPSSVVKELVENSIDAESKFITVEIKNGGVKYIRVTDDGIGMSKEDAKIAFERHATSKITNADDLYNINTLGFRGEALASIASVSDVELITKSKDESSGTNIVIRGGKIISQNEIGCPNGTTITIRNLFYNTPARMKFLKKDSNEASYVSDIIFRLVFANPYISFKYINNGKEVVYTAGDSKLINCIYSIYGKDYAKNMIEVNYESNGIIIKGLTGNSNISRGNRSFQSFFINGRYIKSNILSYAVKEAYKNEIMKNKFPVVVIHLKINPSLFDVNVHPSKLEVKFSREKEVFDAVYWGIKNALKSKFNIPQINSKRQNFEFIPTKKEIFKKDNKEITKIDDKVINNLNEIIMSNNYKSENIQRKSERAEQISFRDTNNNVKILGQLFLSYIVAEKDDKMLLIDQHAAHERLRYEELLKKHRNNILYPQKLLSPVVVLLSPEEFDIFKNNSSILNNLGFEAEEFGNNSIVIRQAPIPLQEKALQDMFSEIIDIIKNNGENIITEMEYKILYLISCRGAMKANLRMNEKEMEKLVLDVLSLENINTCPHGRPIMISMSKYQLEKDFKRVGI